MTRRTGGTALLTLTLGAVLSAVLAVTLQPATATTGRDTVRHYVAHDLPGEFAYADAADPHNGEPGPGDVLAFTQRLSLHGHPVGRVSNVAVGVDRRRHLFQANGTMDLAHGTVEFAGLVAQTERFSLAVTGGTGSFEGATGTLVFTNIRGTQVLTLRLAG